MKEITSVSNPQVKAWKKLATKKELCALHFTWLWFSVMVSVSLVRGEDHTYLWV